MCQNLSCRFRVSETRLGQEPHPAPETFYPTRTPCRVSYSAESPSHNDALSYTAKLQALVYDTLPSTTAVFSYAIDSWKLSAEARS